MKAFASFVRHHSGVRGLALAVACATLLSGCVSTPAQPQFMPLGRATMAPQGFLQFCAREPQQCGGSPIGSPGDSQKQMMQKQWAAIFASSPATTPPPQPVMAAVESSGASRAAVEPTIADAPPFIQVTLRDRAETGRYDWTPIFGPAAGSQAPPAVASTSLNSSPLLRYLVADSGPTAASSTAALPPPTFELVSAPVESFSPSFLGTRHEAKAFLVALNVPVLSAAAPTAPFHEADTAPSGPVQPLRLDSRLMQQLTDINTRVNSAISPASDLEAFGANDVWTLPLEDGGPARGNCKHYALEKQHALTLAGLPPSNLSLAIVRTRWGELHAVLLVRTDQGELVLDNLTPSIRSWRDVDYTWIERQKPDEPLVWVALAAGAPGQG